MAKYSNLNVLSNIKLNGAIYTNPSNSSNSKPAIKYDKTLSAWVYKNEKQTDWIQFSASNVDIIKELVQLNQAKENSVPNCNVMTTYVDEQFRLHIEDENQSLSGIYDDIKELSSAVDAIQVVSVTPTEKYLSAYQLQGLNGTVLGSTINIPRTISDASEISYKQSNVSAELENISSALENVSAEVNNKVNTSQITDTIDSANGSATEIIPSNNAVVNYVTNVISDLGTNTEIQGLRTAVNNITLSKNTTTNDAYAATYTFTNAKGETAEINIPKDQFLKDAEYIPSSEVLRFTFKLNREGETDNIVDIPVSGLVDTYVAGNGIIINNDGQITIKQSESDIAEEFLFVNETGIGISGVQTAINNASSNVLTDANTYADNLSNNLSDKISKLEFIKSVDTIPTVNEIEDYKYNTLVFTDDKQAAVVIIDGETREVVDISYKVANAILTTTDGSYLPDVNAVTAFVDDKINNIVFPEQLPPEVFYVPEVPTSGSNTYSVSGIYIDELGNAIVYIPSSEQKPEQIIELSQTTVNSFEDTKNTNIPTIGAVSAFVDEKISDFLTSGEISAFVDEKINNIDFPDFDGFYKNGKGIQIKSDNTINVKIADPNSVKTKDNYLYSDQANGVYTSGITEKFDEIPVIAKSNSELLNGPSGLYYAENGKASIWNGTQKIDLSYEIIDSITQQNESSTEQVPSVKAITDFVADKTSNLLTDSSLSSINSSIKTLSSDVELLKTNSGKAEVFYIETFDIYTEENTPTVSGLYINHDGETRFWDGSVWENTSYALTDEITGPNESQVPSVKAVCDYVSSAINNIPAPEIPEATTYQPGDGIDITDNTDAATKDAYPYIAK